MAEKMLSHNMRNVLEPIKKDISNYSKTPSCALPICAQFRLCASFLTRYYIGVKNTLSLGEENVVNMLRFLRGYLR